MEFIYGVCYQVFSVNLLSNQSKGLKLSLYLIVELTIIGQNSQFFWNPLLTKNNWSTYYDFWNTINLPSVDVLAAKFNYIPGFLIFELVLISLIFLHSFAIILMNILKKDPPKFLLITTKAIFYIICEVVFIPTCILLCVVFKYSGNGGEYVVEYPSVVHSSIVDFGLAGRIGAPLVIFLFLLLTLLYEISNYDIRISKNTLLENEKISPSSGILMKLTYFINSYFFTTFQLADLESYLYFAVGNYLVLTIFIVSSVPFYSIFLNSLKVWSHLNMTLMSVLFLIGFKLNDMSITFILTVFLQPSLLFFSYYLVKYRLTFIDPIEKVQRRKFSTFELAIRMKLITGELNENLLRFMNKNFKIYENKVNIVLQSYYCLYSLGDISLALCKISQINFRGFNIIENYQVFKCKKIIEKHCRETSESYKILKYFEDFAKVKKDDKNLCKNFLVFFRLFTDSNFSLSKIKYQINLVENKIFNLKNKYCLILSQFPNSLEVKEYYGSLLCYLLNDRDNGQKLLDKSSAISYKLNYNEMSLSKRESIFIVSAKPVGKIVYFNRLFLNSFSISAEVAKNIHLNQFLPKTLTRSHNTQLAEYHFKCLAPALLKENPAFFLDSGGYLTEFILNIESTGDTKSCYFIYKLNNIDEKNRAFALIGNDGFINEHSTNLAKILIAEKKRVEGYFLSEFLEDFSMNEIKLNEINCKKIRNSQKTIFFVLKRVLFLSQNLQVMYFSEENGLAKLKDQSNFFKKELENSSDKDEDQTEKKKAKKLKFSSKDYISSISMKSENIKKSIHVKNSIRAFNIVKILLLISIAIIFIFTLAITVITQSEVEHSKDLSVLKTLNDISYSFSRISLISLSLYIKKLKGLDLPFSQSDLEREINTLVQLNIDLKDNFNDWSYCSSSNIVLKKLLLYWTSEVNLTAVSANLHEVITFISESSRSFIEANFNKNDLFKVYYSSTGFSYSKLNAEIKKLTKHENKRIKDIEYVTFILLIIGIAASLISLAVVCVFMIHIEEFLKNLWTTLSLSLKKKAINMRFAVLERLSEMHNMSYLLEINDLNESKEFKQINHRQYPWYILRFSILYVICIASYLAMTLYFCESVRIVLYNKPLTINQLLSKKNEVSLLSLYTFDTQMILINESTINIFTHYYLSPSPVTKSNLLFNQISENWSYLEAASFDSDISNTLSSFIVNNFNHSHNILSIGLIPAFNSILQDSLYLRKLNELDNLSLFLKNCEKFTTEIDVLIKDLTYQFNSAIDKRYQSLVFYYVFSTVFILIFYLVFYHKFLDEEIKIIVNIIHIIDLIPISNIKIAESNESKQPRKKNNEISNSN